MPFEEGEVNVAEQREHVRLACRVYHSDQIEPEWFGVLPETIEWRSIDELQARGLVGSGAAVVIVDGSLRSQIESIARIARRAVFVAADSAAEEMLAPRRFVSVADVSSAVVRAHLLAAACELACTHATARRRRRYLVRVAGAVREINRVGLGLMLEHDERRLLRRIVRLGKRLTRSDAGALLLVETDTKRDRLRLVHADFDTIRQFELGLRTLAVDDTSIIGHAAKSREPVVIPDAYDLPPDARFVIDRSFDEQYGYRRRSMLIVPMIDRGGKLVGVMVFINRKTNRDAMITSKAAADQFVVPYRAREVRVARALAGIAAISIENVHLHAQIERMLESFVRASVTAIDQRDPTTAGHSLRVATLSAAMARAVDHATTGTYASTRFSRSEMRELHFAALLHDFGKVAVREEVLVKPKKLPRVLWERVNARFDVILRTLELESCAMTRGQHLSSQDGAGLDEVVRLRELVTAANEPAVTERPPSPELGELARRTFQLPDGTVMPYLTAEELHYLRLRHGTLDDDERAQIEAHAEATHEFLVKIPWTEDLKNVAEYAYGHHEKLDGSGYPRHLAADDIAVQTRIITIADIFDALTAADRPYKPAVSIERALDILIAEAKRGLLDEELVRLLIESQSHRNLATDE